MAIFGISTFKFNWDWTCDKGSAKHKRQRFKRQYPWNKKKGATRFLMRIVSMQVQWTDSRIITIFGNQIVHTPFHMTLMLWLSLFFLFINLQRLARPCRERRRTVFCLKYNWKLNVPQNHGVLVPLGVRCWLVWAALCVWCEPNLEPNTFIVQPYIFCRVQRWHTQESKSKST